MLFSAASVIGAIIMAFVAAPHDLINSSTFHVARALAYNFVNVYMIKMAAVFIVSLSTVIIATEISARWLAYVGYALAALLLFGSSYIDWAFLAFPTWVLMISVHILIDNFRHSVDPINNASG
jgi:hypothetical protein